MQSMHNNPMGMTDATGQPRPRSLPMAAAVTSARVSGQRVSRGRGAHCRHVSLLLLLALTATACTAKPDYALVSAVERGQYAQARVNLEQRVGPAQSGGFDRDYVLDRMRLALVTMADGYVEPANPIIEDLYDVLTRQGLNADKTVASVVINEDLKIWKGEPFEQAMALHYIAMHWAAQGSWDNARAAISRSLFHLRDSGVESVGRIDARGVLSRTYADERREREGAVVETNHGYVTRRSNFALGYLMTAIANEQMALATGDANRQKEAADNYREAVNYNPALQGVVERLRDTSSYNAVFVVDFGAGPRKIATGPDGAIVRYLSMTPSDNRALTVRVEEGLERSTAAVPIACDVNSMAHSHLWNALEEARVIKSTIGSGLLGAGAATTGYGAHRRDEGVALVGVGLMLAGAFAKAGSHADTRHCEVMPQRVYVVPAMIQSTETRVTLQVEGEPGSRLVLTGVSPPAPGDPAVLRYVRLVQDPAAARWAASGEIYYSNTFTGDLSRPGVHNFPYLIGGNDVRPPTEQTLESYRESGWLRDYSLGQLQELYRAEGIYHDARDTGGAGVAIGKHVLEGGKSLVAPVPGTTGFARLFGQRHPPYPARSDYVQREAARMNTLLEQQRAPSVVQGR